MKGADQARDRDAYRSVSERGVGQTRAAVVPTVNVVHVAAAAVLAALSIYLLVVGGRILEPLVMAVLVWHLINGLVDALGRVGRRIKFRGRVLPRSARVAVSTVAVMLLAWLMITIAVGSIDVVVSRAPVYEQNLRNAANLVTGWLGLEELSEELSLFERNRITNIIRILARSLTGVLGTSATVAVFVLFLLLEQHLYDRKIALLFPGPEREARVRRILHQIECEIQSYIWLKTLLGLLVAGLSYIIIKSVGVDLAEFWAVVIFVLSYVPYIGAWFGVIFPTALALVQFDTRTPFLVTAGGLAVVQFTCGSILEPRIMGRGLNISPLVMLLSLSVWGAVWGVVGMFLAVPIMVVVLIICSHFEATRPIAILMSATGEVRN
jgi:predicted PurR-regulated permease PerM